MAQRHNYTKWTPNVDEKSTPSRFYWDFLQDHAPRMGFGPYEEARNYQDRF